jgi:hypothetical protein
VDEFHKPSNSLFLSFFPTRLTIVYTMSSLSAESIVALKKQQLAALEYTQPRVTSNAPSTTSQSFPQKSNGSSKKKKQKLGMPVTFGSL